MDFGFESESIAVEPKSLSPGIVVDSLDEYHIRVSKRLGVRN